MSRASLPAPSRGGVVNRGKTEAETCQLNGWTVGTRLVGDEGYGPTVITITAIGEGLILAKTDDRSENSWTLSCREWQAAAAAGKPPCTCASRKWGDPMCPALIAEARRLREKGEG